MQKDALIERVASVQALISRKTHSEVRSEDQVRITELRGFLTPFKSAKADILSK